LARATTLLGPGERWQDWPDVGLDRLHRRVWQRHRDPDRFIFPDETGTAPNLVRRYDLCAKGQHLVASATGATDL
jgi:hypothetical protein